MSHLKILLFLAILCSCKRQTNITEHKPLKEDAYAATANSNPMEPADGIVFFSHDNGVTWENKSDGLPGKCATGLGAIAVAGNSLGIAIKEKGIYLFDFQKGSWVNIPTDRKIIEHNLGALAFYKNQIYVGTQFGGVFSTSDQGNNWTNRKGGLASLTIRKLVQMSGKLFAGTDAGLYSYNDLQKKWELEYGNSTMQVNGMTEFDGSIYMATNQGAFKASNDGKEWAQILPNHALHNISSDDKTIYAMTYNELFSSTNKGISWQSIQKGLPKDLYTFNVIENDHSIFAGQWDGVYRKDHAFENWKSYSTGLPSNLAITNMKVYNGIIVISGNERGLKKGVTLDK